ncbi:MAG: hypothetical protein ABFD92_03875 [Planctomycetaceae bacterium]|nr:hypothetical protein [Planctomycetaceae bacterium]
MTNHHKCKNDPAVLPATVLDDLDNFICTVNTGTSEAVGTLRAMARALAKAELIAYAAVKTLSNTAGADDPLRASFQEASRKEAHQAQLAMRIALQLGCDDVIDLTDTFRHKLAHDALAYKKRPGETRE